MRPAPPQPAHRSCWMLCTRRRSLPLAGCLAGSASGVAAHASLLGLWLVMLLGCWGGASVPLAGFAMRRSSLPALRGVDPLLVRSSRAGHDAAGCALADGAYACVCVVCQPPGVLRPTPVGVWRDARLCGGDRCDTRERGNRSTLQASCLDKVVPGLRTCGIPRVWCELSAICGRGGR